MAADPTINAYITNRFPRGARVLNVEGESLARGPFDVIIADGIVERTENPSAFLRSCKSALAPDGVVIVTTPNIGSIASRLQVFRRGYPNAFGRTQTHRISMISRTSIGRIAERAGLRVAKAHYLGGPQILRGLLAKTCVFFLS